jgi:hypothetical protein
MLAQERTGHVGSPRHLGVAPGQQRCGQRTAQEAIVQVIPAHRSEDWIDRPGDLAVVCDDHGMWTVTRTLAVQYAPIVNELGNHNMDLDRALRGPSSCPSGPACLTNHGTLEECWDPASPYLRRQLRRPEWRFAPIH